MKATVLSAAQFCSCPSLRSFLHQHCLTAAAAPPVAPVVCSKLILHTTVQASLSRLTRPQQYCSAKNFRSSSALCCIKPGSKPEEVVKRITKDDVEVTFARSGGAGGQNVNKVNTKVDMRLSLDVDWLSDELRDALGRLEKKRINKEGELVLTSQKTRSQADNLEDALDKLQNCLDRAAESIIPAKPDPMKAKEIAKRKHIANENRIQDKKMKADKKSQRRGKIEW